MATKKVNIDIVAKDKSQQALNKVRGSLDKVKSSVFNVRNALIGLGAGLVVRNIVNTGRELENLQVRLKFLLKDANEGAKAFENMTKFASQVPFSLEEIQSGAGILATVTDNADGLQKMLEITGNVAATTGLDFRTAAEQIQRSFSAGIGAADLFREKGVRNMLGFQAGATVSIEETVAAFERVFGQGGKFGKSTDELAKTFGGTMSMLGDKIFRFKQVLLDAGFFDSVKQAFSDLNNFVDENQEAFDALAKFLGGAFTIILEGLVATVRGVARAFAKTKDILQELTDFVGITDKAVREQIQAYKENSKAAMQMSNATGDLLINLELSATSTDKSTQSVKMLKEEYGLLDGDLRAMFPTLTAYKEHMDNMSKSNETTSKSLISAQQNFRDLQDEIRGLSNEELKEFESVEEKKVRTRKKANNQIFNNTKDSLKALSGLNRTAFEAFKRFQIAEATINAIKAASNAFRQFPFPINIAVGASELAKGMALVAQIKSTNFREKGGPVSQGQAYMVGEKGPEMFVPNQSGNIVANNKLGGQPVTVNFNINTVDARGFNELLTNSRGVIVNMINSAVNETGRQAIV